MSNLNIEAWIQISKQIHYAPISSPRTILLTPLQWRHNGYDGVSNHQPHDCVPNRLFRRRSKKISKLRATGLCAGNSPVTGEFPAQMASHVENVSGWWRLYDMGKSLRHCPSWASYQIRKIVGCECAGNAGRVSPVTVFKRKTLVNDPGMHHGMCITHVPWCMSGSLICGGGEIVPGIPAVHTQPAILRIW